MSEKHWYRDGWPWGQFCVFLLAICVFVMGMETLITYVAVYAHLISPPATNEASSLQPFMGVLLLLAVGCAIMAFANWVRRRVQKLPPLTRWLRLRAASQTLFVVGILAQMIAMSLPAAVGARKAQQQAIAAGPWRNHVFANGAIQISTPANWEVVPNPNASVNAVYIADRQNDLYLTAVLIPKQDVAVKSLAELSRQSAVSLNDRLTEPWTGNAIPREANGLATIDIVQKGTLDGLNLVWMTRHIESADSWIELRLWTTRSRYESHGETFLKIADSVRRTQ